MGRPRETTLESRHREREATSKSLTERSVDTVTSRLYNMQNGHASGQANGHHANGDSAMSGNAVRVLSLSEIRPESKLGHEAGRCSCRLCFAAGPPLLRMLRSASSNLALPDCFHNGWSDPTRPRSGHLNHKWRSTNFG